MSAIKPIGKSTHPLMVGFVGISLTAIVTALYWFGLLETLELKSYDLRFNIRGPVPSGNDILLVTIDPATVKDLNIRTTAISRDMQAQVIYELIDRGAKLVVYDMDLSKPSENAESDYSLQQVLAEYPGTVVMARYISGNEWVRPNQIFREAMVSVGEWYGSARPNQRGNLEISWNQNNEVDADGYVVFLSAAPITDPYGERVEELATLPADMNSIVVPDLSRKVEYHYLVLGHKTSHLLAGEGTINEIEDRDDRVRRKALRVKAKPTLENPDPEWVPTLSLAAAIPVLWPQTNPGKCSDDPDLFCLKGGKEEIRIPLVNGNMLINFAGPKGTFPSISFSRLLPEFINNKKLPVVEGRIVLIGNTHPTAHDEYPTPFGLASSGQERTEFGYTPGLEIHANALKTILDRSFIRAQNRRSALLMILAAGLVISAIWILTRAFSVPGILVLAVSLGGMLIIAQYLFNNYNYWLVLTPLLLVTGLNYLGVLVVQTVGEYREKQFIKGAFGMYLPPAVIEEIIKDPDKLNLGGEDRVMTALFSDVQSFSSISEKLTPQDLVHLLNEYLTLMCDVIFEYEGTVDKFEGDAIIAFFGAPIWHEDHASRACLAALAMNEKNEELNRKLSAEGRPRLITRIGLNTGHMVVGNMGSAQRMNYTMMGDNVNLAARLEGANKQYSSLLMISEFTYEQAKDAVEVRELDLITVVGKEKPARVYELIAAKGKLDPKKAAAMSVFNEGLRIYREQKWDEAKEKFEKVISELGQDPPSQTYIDRCEEFRNNPPGPGWDGVYKLKTK